MKPRTAGGAGSDGGQRVARSLTRPARGFIENLEHSIGDADTRHRMSAALHKACERTDRLCDDRKRPLDLERARARHEHLRGVERYLSALTWYSDRREEREARRQRPPTRVQRLRDGLLSGRFCPPGAEALLRDVEHALAGDRAARLRVLAYLKTPGVLEVLDRE